MSIPKEETFGNGRKVDFRSTWRTAADGRHYVDQTWDIQNDAYRGAGRRTIPVTKSTGGRALGKFAKNFGKYAKYAKVSPQGIIAGAVAGWAIEEGWQWVEDNLGESTGSWQKSTPTTKSQQNMQNACWAGWGADKPGYSYNKAGPVIAHDVHTVTFTCHMYFADTDMGPLPAGANEGVKGSVIVGRKTMSRYDMEWELTPVNPADFETSMQRMFDQQTATLGPQMVASNDVLEVPKDTLADTEGSFELAPVETTKTEDLANGGTRVSRTTATTTEDVTSTYPLVDGLTVTSTRTVTKTEVTTNNPDGSTETETSTETKTEGASKDKNSSNPENKPVEIPDYCKEYPNRLGCVDVGELPPSSPIPEQEVTTSFTWTAFAMPSYCPAPKAINAGGSVYQFSYQPVCDVVTGVRPVLLALAFVIAGFIVFGALRNG